jgi:glycosyltransferase involved in cell wall biosynthesis
VPCSLGGGEHELPTHDWLHRLGFVSEELKHDALSGAAVVAAPSPNESLSLTQLEAWSHGRPTLANAASPVLVGSRAGPAAGSGTATRMSMRPCWIS